MSGIPQFIAPTELPVLLDHPFAETERLFIFRRPLSVELAPDDSGMRQFNPGSELAQKVVRKLEAVRDTNPDLYFPELILVDTHPDSSVMSQQYPRLNITNADGVAMVGGDGNAKKGNRAAREADFKGPMVQLAAGNACDLAHMLFRAGDIKNPVRAILESRLAKLYPLAITIETPGQKTVMQETEYCFSAGQLLYNVAKRVSSSEHRFATKDMGEVQRLLADTKLTLDEIAATKSLIRIEDNDGVRFVSDIVFTNGWRMAKKVRFQGVHLLEPGFGRIDLERSTKRAVATTAIRGRTGYFPHYEGEQQYSFRISSKDEAPVKVQQDGEVDKEFEIPSGSLVTVCVSESWTNQATTRRRA